MQKLVMMIKSLILLLVFFITNLEARDNPFRPVEQVYNETLHTPIPIPDFVTNPVPVIAKKDTYDIHRSVVKPIVLEETIPKKKLSKISIIPSKKIIRRHKTKKTFHKTKYTQVYANTNLKIYVSGNHIKIVTHDKLIKSLQLREPNRFVFDFGDDFIIYKSFKKNIYSPYVKKLSIGTHDCFYRVSFVIKKVTRYKIKHTFYGYLITLLP